MQQSQNSMRYVEGRQGFEIWKRFESEPSIVKT